MSRTATLLQIRALALRQAGLSDLSDGTLYAADQKMILDLYHGRKGE